MPCLFTGWRCVQEMPRQDRVAEEVQQVQTNLSTGIVVSSTVDLRLACLPWKCMFSLYVSALSLID
jgi:hypothetical protein